MGHPGDEMGYYAENNNQYHHMNYVNSQGISAGYKNYPPSNGSYQGGRNGNRTHDRQHQEQYREMRNGISGLRFEDSGTINSRQSTKMSNSGQSVVNGDDQFVRNTSPLPTPPTKWFHKENSKNGNLNSGGAVKVYQVKTQVSPQDWPGSGLQPL